VMDMGITETDGRWQGCPSREGVPTERECEELLRILRVTPQAAAHSRMVADVAGRLASRLLRRGIEVDPELVRAAALLHDLARAEPDHAGVAARVVRELGYSRVAACIACHMDIEINPGEKLSEAQLLYLADKLVLEGRIVSLEERLSAMMHRFACQPEAADAARARLRKAAIVRNRVEEAVGLPFERLLAEI
jgi:putative nucleotidyltransferase with HDIG domain